MMGGMDSSRMNVVDLFAGAGGLSYGLQMAGCNVILGVDNDEDCAQTFLKNHPKAVYLTKNIDDVTYADISRILHNVRIDILVGGPPCQGFSVSGKRKLEDPRNLLYLHFFRIADLLKPRAIVIENVPGLRTLFNGRVFEDIIKNLEKRGYTSTFKVVSADEYGVPQSRKRVFIVGIGGGGEGAVKHTNFHHPSNNELHYGNQ